MESCCCVVSFCNRKSTQLPQYLAELLDKDGTSNQRVICTQPRKVSATSLAERVSEEWYQGDKTKLGNAVGYRVGSSKKAGKYTKIEYITEGTFLGSLLQLFGNKGQNNDDREITEAKLIDPLKGVGAVIVDEAHERSTTCDIILGILKMHTPLKWPNLKVIITSATLDSELFSNYFHNAPVLKIPGRMYPVEVKYMPLEDGATGMTSSSDKYADAVVKTALEIHKSSGCDSGDILCFLTGQDETERAKAKFSVISSKLNYSPVMPLALYGKQLPDEQRLVFNKAPPGTRKVIFATDVAETGVTIDGVRHIVDSGLCKESRYDPKRNVTILSVQSICQSSAIQRKGRAGRTAPGTCYRLYSEDDFDSLDISQAPEILSRPLPLTVISLLAMGIHPLHFEWIQPPEREGLQKALDELNYLGAIVVTTSPTGTETLPTLTELGCLIADLQMDPGMARMIHRACQQGMGDAACSLAGIMSVASSFYYRGAANDVKGRESADAKHLDFCSEAGDMISMYGVFREWMNVLNANMTSSCVTSPGKQPLTGGDDMSVISTLDDDTSSIESSLIETSPSSADGRNDGNFSDDEDIGGKNDSNLNAMFASLGQGSLGVAPLLTSKDDTDFDDDSTVMSDGDISIISELSEQNKVTETTFEQERVSRYAASNAAKRWCLHNYVNNKSLNIALSSKNDMIRVLKKFNKGALWNFLPNGTATDQMATPSTNDIQRLIVKGLFLNVSIQTSEFRGYEVLRNDTPTVGVIHPGSSLSKIANNRTDGGNSSSSNIFPKFIVFHTMMTTSRTFLNVVTPIQEEWIQEESPEFYSNIMVTNMAKSRCAKLLLEGIRVNTSRALLGKFGDKKRELEETLNCSIQYDFSRSTLEVWCTPGNLQTVKHRLQEGIESVKRTCLEAVEETVICGRTRAIFGSGGLVKCLLFDEEFVTVNISGLVMSIKPEELNMYLSNSFGKVRSIDLTYPGGGVSSNRKGNAFAKVVFHCPEDAARAQEQLQGEVWKGQTLTASRGGVRSSALQTVNSTSQVIMSWSLSPSQCKASADFSTPDAANSLLQICLSNKGLRCPILQGLGTQVHIRANIPKAANNTAKPTYLFPTSQSERSNQKHFFRITINGLYPHVDEQDLEDAFKQIEQLKRSNSMLASFRCPSRVKVFRAAAPEAVVDETSLSIETADLRNMIPMRNKLVSATSFFDGGGGGSSGRAGFYLQYATPEDSAEVRLVWERQLDEMKRLDTRSSDGKHSWMKHGQPIRMREKFSSLVNIHTALYNFFNDDLHKCMDTLRVRLNVTSRLAKPKNGSNSKYSDPKITIYLNAPNPASLNLAIEALNEVLRFKVYTPRNDEEKHVLFSYPGRRAMAAISKQTAYLHWENSTRIVRVYGSEEVVDATMMKITETIKEIADAQEIVSYLVSRFKRKDLLAAWRQLEGSLKDDVMGFAVNGLKLEVQARADTHERLRTWLAAGKFIVSHEPSKQALTTGIDEELCSLCMCEVDQPSYYYRACDHGGCVSCLNYQFSRLAEITVPATCFSTDCGRCHISWPDIKAVVPPEAVDVIKSAAVSKYVRENSQSVRYCPAHGCDQILNIASLVIPQAEREEEMRGGTVAYCDRCRVEYCLCCSDRDLKPRESHKGDSCSENIEEANAWRVHFQHIADNILTLRCPSCEAAFIDFDGCCAVACGGSGCGKYFCGLCLEPHPNSSVSHAHVRICVKNPHKGDYFCSRNDLNTVHRYTTVGSLRNYLLKTVPKGDTKRKLMKNLEPLLADLNIFPSDVL